MKEVGDDGGKEREKTRENGKEMKEMNNDEK